MLPDAVPDGSASSKKYRTSNKSKSEKEKEVVNTLPIEFPVLGTPQPKANLEPGIVKTQIPISEDLNLLSANNMDDESTLADYEDFLVMAQQHFDDLRRKLSDMGSSQESSKKSNGRPNAQEEDKSRIRSDHLLSTLLYLGVMINQVNDIKLLLKYENEEAYNEWAIIIDSLHPPPFHVRERQLQNERVKRVYERKQFYKMQMEEEGEKWRKEREVFQEQEAKNNKTLENMATSISRLTEQTKTMDDQCAMRFKAELELGAVHHKTVELKERLTQAESSVSALKKKLDYSEEQHALVIRRSEDSIISLNERLWMTENELSRTKQKISVLIAESSSLNAALESSRSAERHAENAMAKARNLELDLEESRQNLKSSSLECQRVKNDLAEALASKAKTLLRLEEQKDTLQNIWSSCQDNLKLSTKIGRKISISELRRIEEESRRQVDLKDIRETIETYSSTLNIAKDNTCSIIQGYESICKSIEQLTQSLNQNVASMKFVQTHICDFQRGNHDDLTKNLNDVLSSLTSQIDLGIIDSSQKLGKIINDLEDISNTKATASDLNKIHSQLSQIQTSSSLSLAGQESLNANIKIAFDDIVESFSALAKKQSDRNSSQDHAIEEFSKKLEKLQCFATSTSSAQYAALEQSSSRLGQIRQALDQLTEQSVHRDDMSNVRAKLESLEHTTSSLLRKNDLFAENLKSTFEAFHKSLLALTASHSNHDGSNQEMLVGISQGLGELVRLTIQMKDQGIISNTESNNKMIQLKEKMDECNIFLLGIAEQKVDHRELIEVQTHIKEMEKALVSIDTNRSSIEEEIKIEKRRIDKKLAFLSKSQIKIQELHEVALAATTNQLEKIGSSTVQISEETNKLEGMKLILQSMSADKTNLPDFLKMQTQIENIQMTTAKAVDCTDSLLENFKFSFDSLEKSVGAMNSATVQNHCSQDLLLKDLSMQLKELESLAARVSSNCVSALLNSDTKMDHLKEIIDKNNSSFEEAINFQTKHICSNESQTQTDMVRSNLLYPMIAENLNGVDELEDNVVQKKLEDISKQLHDIENVFSKQSSTSLQTLTNKLEYIINMLTEISQCQASQSNLSLLQDIVFQIKQLRLPEFASTKNDFAKNIQSDSNESSTKKLSFNIKSFEEAPKVNLDENIRAEDLTRTNQDHVSDKGKGGNDLIDKACADHVAIQLPDRLSSRKGSHAKVLGEIYSELYSADGEDHILSKSGMLRKTIDHEYQAAMREILASSEMQSIFDLDTECSRILDVPIPRNSINDTFNSKLQMNTPISIFSIAQPSTKDNTDSQDQHEVLPLNFEKSSKISTKSLMETEDTSDSDETHEKNFLLRICEERTPQTCVDNEEKIVCQNRNDYSASSIIAAAKIEAINKLETQLYSSQNSNYQSSVQIQSLSINNIKFDENTSKDLMLSIN